MAPSLLFRFLRSLFSPPVLAASSLCVTPLTLLPLAANSTGTHSVYTTLGDDLEIMFHVVTLLPFSATDEQQVLAQVPFSLALLPLSLSYNVFCR